MKIQIILKKVKSDLLSGNLGASGDKFMIAEDIMKRYGVSFVSALKIINYLVDNDLIVPIGNKKFIMNGLYKKDCELFKLFESKRKKIGILTQNITNPFFSKVTESIYNTVLKNGNIPILKLSSRDTEKDTLVSLVKEGCHGIISFFQNNTPDTVDIYERLPVPVVFIHDSMPIKNASVVNSDNRISGYYAAKHLVEYGYSSLYTCSSFHAVESQRFLGFTDYLNEHDIPFGEEKSLFFNLSNPYKNHSFINTIKSDPAERIGIFCYHDLIAEYLYNLLKINRIDVPEKVGIVGYDKLDTIIPSGLNLTTFSYSFDDIARSAYDLLMQNCETLTPNPVMIREHTFLVIGKTTSKM